MTQYITLVRLRGDQASGSSSSSSPLRNPSQIVNDAVKKNGGTVLSSHATLGRHDIVVISQFPDQQSAMKAFTQIGVQNSWQTETLAAEPLANFDTIYSEAQRDTSRSSSRS